MLTHLLQRDMSKRTAKLQGEEEGRLEEECAAQLDQCEI